MKSWSSNTVLALTELLANELKKKTKRCISFNKIDDKRICDAANAQSFKKQQKHLSQQLNWASCIADELNSGRIDYDTFVVCYFSEWVQLKKCPDIFSLNKNLRKIIIFNSILNAGVQFKMLSELNEEYKNQPKFTKFSGSRNTLFGVDEEQKNKLYELVEEGKVSLLLYAYLLRNNKFAVDESKIKDLDYFKFIKVVNYINEKNIQIEKIKYIE